jgi:hypothetical protein
VAIDLETAMVKLAELERRDGPARFRRQIYSFPATFGEYYLADEFGVQHAGTGSMRSHYRSRTDGREYDLQYVQMAYAIAHRTGNGTFIGKLAAAGAWTAWVDFCIIVGVVKRVGGNRNAMHGLQQFSHNGANYHGYNMGLAAADFDSMSAFVERGLPRFLATYNGHTFRTSA